MKKKMQGKCDDCVGNDNDDDDDDGYHKYI